MKIALLGDAAFYGKFSLKRGNPKALLQRTAEYLHSFDYVVLNLETPFADDSARKFGNKSAYIRSDRENIELLKYLGVNAVCLANNHMFDFGYDSFELTKRLLEDNQIDYFGVENKDLKIEIEGNKIAFHGFCCYSTNPINATSKGVNPLNYETFKNTLTTDNTAGYISIISVHAGQEHVNYPNYDHVEFARKLSTITPYIYYGHHPHVLQGIEMVNDSLIAYSLGNFCFDDVYTEKSPLPLVKMTDNNKSSVILSLELSNNNLVKFDVIPVFDGELCNGELKDRINRNIEIYSAQLQERKEDYMHNRQLLLNTYLESRKKNKNLKWYLKRLNYNSLKMILNSRRNLKRYNEMVKKYI